MLSWGAGVVIKETKGKLAQARDKKRRKDSAPRLTEALGRHSKLLIANTEATLANTRALAKPPCGTVSAGARSSRPEIRKRVLQVANKSQDTEDGAPFSEFPDSSPDPWVFAQDCMNQRQFASDGLALDRLYVEKNWGAGAKPPPTLATIVSTIASCYQYPR
jgi:hypothetical protein